MNIWLLIDLLLSLLTKIAELIAEWRSARGDGYIEGVGRVADRVDAIVQRQNQRTDLAKFEKQDANAIRRRDALEEMEAVGIHLRERDRRLLLESALVRSELLDSENRGIG